MVIVILSILLAIFVTTTAVLAWFSFRLVKQLLLIEDGISDLQYVVKNFYEHLEEVNAMDTFHGEPTIQSLIEHSTQVILQVKKFEESYVITEGDLQGDVDIEESEEQAILYK